MNSEQGIIQLPVHRVRGAVTIADIDDVSVEEPLQINVAWEDKHGCHQRQIAVTMRTPGDDQDLTIGFLFTEGVIMRLEDVVSIETASSDTVVAILRPTATVNMAMLNRHSFVSSSCGTCGKRALDGIRITGAHRLIVGDPSIAPHVIHALPEKLRRAQAEFSRTGGIHASGLFDADGHLLALREDVGRHNALDKLIGSQLLANRLPLSGRILVVSGRVSFELVQKAAMAGITVLCAVGAPSSLAVELATECGMTLIGFVREDRFNIYHDCGRLSAHRTSALDLAA